MSYYLRVLPGSGALFEELTKVDGTYRVCVGDSLKVVIDCGNNFAQLDCVLRVVNGDGSIYTLPFERTNLGSGVCEWIPTVSGPAQLSISTCSVVPHEPAPLQSSPSLIVVQPRLVIGGKTIPHEAVCMTTVISQRLGPIDRWMDVLRTVARQRFNAVHFTPIQVLGESRSSYSIAEPTKISSAFTQLGWHPVRRVLDDIRSEYGLLAFSDLVLNHAASNSPWLAESPDCGYNEINCPWLLGAVELDNAIKKFNREVVEGKWASRYGVSCDIRSEQTLNSLLNAFREQCLNHFKLSSFFTVDINAVCESLRQELHAGLDARRLGAGHEEEFAFQEALKLVGTSRTGFVYPPGIAAQISDSVGNLRCILERVQARLYRKADEVYQSIVKGLEGTVRYERLESKKGKIDCSPWNSMVPWYFTPVKCSKDGQTYHLANNGWVMGWDTRKDFAQAGNLVYLSRSLVAWSDCIKLRYGEKPEDAPELWRRMSEYCELTAEAFDGVRLDNCHSTPLHVGKYLLSKARAKRPNIFVFAELFTGDAVRDVTYERELGLDALVREAVQTDSPGDLAWHCIKFGGRRPGSLAHNERVPPMHYIGEGCKLLEPSPVKTLFYDCTHDNETPFQKGRAQDVLACAAMVGASPYAVGSTFGYEVLVKSNPSVMADEKLYQIYNVKHDETNKNREPREALHIEWRGRAKDVKIWGSFNSWRDGVEMQPSGSSEEWHAELPAAEYGDWILRQDIQFKYVVDGDWTTSNHYPKTRNPDGHENNVVNLEPGPESSALDFAASPGIIEARRVLNEVHQHLITESFTETNVQWPCSDFSVIERHSPSTGVAAYFFIRSHWWKGNDRPEHSNISVRGRIIRKVLGARVHVDQGQFHMAEDGKHILGMSDHSSCLHPLPDPHSHYDRDNDLTHFNFNYLPSGSVYLVFCEVRRPEPQIQLLLDKRLPESLSGLTLDCINRVLWSCDREERDRTDHKNGVYQFPEMDSLEYAGIAGIVQGIENARFHLGDHDHPFVANVKEGDWLVDYHVERANSLPPHYESFKSFLRDALQAIKHTPHKDLKPAAMDLLFCQVWRVLVAKCLKSMNLLACRDPIMQELAVASTQLIGAVPSASLNENRITPCISAGLPHFTVEYMREWGRDTFIALPGLCLATNRWDDAHREIMAYARVCRHGLLPNLLDSSNNPRYNARDAVWYWLYSVQMYVKFAPNGKELLDHFVQLKYPMGLEYDVPKVETLRELIHLILSCHHRGIKFREWNAGYKVDSQMKDNGFNIEIRYHEETGLCMGGNRQNCGTWMDKMGSSERAGNKGVPATPRDGAPVELSAILYSTLKWIVEDLTPSGLWPSSHTLTLGDIPGISFSEWHKKVKDSFYRCYAVTAEDAERFPHVAIEGTLKDIYGCSVHQEDYHLRCNYSFALGSASDLVPKEAGRRALDIAYQRLMCEPNQVGMKTLDPDNALYRANYDNGNDSTDHTVAHGWNYHNGPEWIWPFGSWLLARYLYGESDRTLAIYNCVAKLTNVAKWIKKAPWWGLPELMDSNGRVCRDSCQTQSWSLGTVLWFMHMASQNEVTWRGNKGNDSEANSEIQTQVPPSPPCAHSAAASCSLTN